MLYSPYQLVSKSKGVLHTSPEEKSGVPNNPFNLTELFCGVWHLLVPNPSPLTRPGTTSYLVGSREVLIIDPGPDIPEHIAAIEDSLKMVGNSPIGVVPTHNHSHHFESAPTLNNFAFQAINVKM
jgi:glyoxylase-like metal-dependent hydrolase (beta-lactamase superfamily II)